jgi:hypothetical protein
MKAKAEQDLIDMRTSQGISTTITDADKADIENRIIRMNPNDGEPILTDKQKKLADETVERSIQMKMGHEETGKSKEDWSKTPSGGGADDSGYKQKDIDEATEVYKLSVNAMMESKPGDNSNTNEYLAAIGQKMNKYVVKKSFSDGTFAYAYDLEYDSSVDADNSEATEVYLVDNRLVMVVQEDDGTTKGELQVQHTTRKRSTGWLKTGKIRYGTVEPKFFRYINLQCTTGQGDNITVYTIDKYGTESSLAIVSEGLSNKDILITTPATKQEFMAFKFVFNNATDDQDLPVLEAYQIKSTPATRRQRLYQYPLSCYDNEMDRFNSIFGYDGRAIEFIQRIESIEETGKFVNVTDYRTGEQYQGVIEEVRFSNESSPDKNSSGFGGLLLVTVRKL